MNEDHRWIGRSSEARAPPTTAWPACRRRRPGGSPGRASRSGKIEYLQEQINEVRRDCEQESKELNPKIDGVSEEMSTKTQETKSALGDLKSKMEKVFVGGGGVMWGLYGVLLMFYGAIAGYFT
jgi:hypothetical protein